MKKSTNEYLEPVLEWLEAGAPHKVVGKDLTFDMNVFSGVPENECGTACCIAGAVAQFNNISTLHYPSCQRDACFALAYEIGMSYDDAEMLFIGEKYESTIIELGDITVKRAANVLKNYMQTGKVEWYDY